MWRMKLLLKCLIPASLLKTAYILSFLYVRYIPSAKECPLQLKLPNGDISKTNGFISPVIHLTLKNFLIIFYKVTKSVNIMKHLFWNVADVGRCCCLESPKLYKRFGKQGSS